MAEATQQAQPQPTTYPPLVEKLAKQYGITPQALLATVQQQCFKDKQATKEQMTALLITAEQYDLNPLLKEIWAFPSSSGIQPVVSVDGWAKIITRHPDYDGAQFQYQYTDEKMETCVAITCKLFRKNHSHPTEATELMRECMRQTPMWKQWPARMLKHKAFIQAARFAFGITGIVDEDESERFVTPAPGVEQRNNENVNALRQKIEERRNVVRPTPKEEASPFPPEVR